MAWLLRTQKVCVYCGSDRDLTGDHLIPISKGGANVRTNTVLACRSCNSRKGRLEDRADMQDGKQVKRGE
jgi:5-methylcytosine-specific restriction endonuclease McrA